MFAARLPPPCLPISKTHNPFKIAGVDMRSEHGRRFRDLAALVIAEHGPDIDPVKVRELAGLKLSIEITQAALVNGDRKARNDLVRLLDHANRAERAMRDAKCATPDKLPHYPPIFPSLVRSPHDRRARRAKAFAALAQV
jgi:hypothetical protein